MSSTQPRLVDPHLDYSLTLEQMIVVGQQSFEQVEAEMLRRHREQVKALPYEGKMGTAFGIAIGDASLKMIFEELAKRGGTWAQIAAASLLVLKKSEDYNKSALTGDAAGDGADKRDVYFPLGHASYAQMIHVKSQRVLALVDAELKGRPTNFEGLRDTALDLINYASFLAERLAREEKA